MPNVKQRFASWTDERQLLKNQQVHLKMAAETHGRIIYHLAKNQNAQATDFVICPFHNLFVYNRMTSSSQSRQNAQRICLHQLPYQCCNNTVKIQASHCFVTVVQRYLMWKTLKVITFQKVVKIKVK